MIIHNFASVLLSLPLDLKAAIYVEGGADAQLGLRSNKAVLTWTGRNSVFLPRDTSQVPIPNILGAQAR
jgi:hypothetical protein